MNTLLIVVHLLACVILILVVLVQSGKDGGLGFAGGGSSQTVFGSAGGADFFTKFTSSIAAVFMITSITLTIIKSGKKHSVFDNFKNTPAATSTIPAPVVPGTPAASAASPAASAGRGAPAAAKK